MTPQQMPRGRLLMTNVAMLTAVLLGWGCGSHSRMPLAPEPATPAHPAAPLILAEAIDPLAQAIQVQNLYSAVLMAIPGVLGTGASLDDLGMGEVVVLVEHAGVPGIPTRLNGLRVEQVVTGILKPWSLTGEYRPIPIGVSVGNADPTACVPGTIGCVVEKNGQKYLLSCNHVFALQNQAPLGSNIVQPSEPDLASPCAQAPANSVIATLAEYEPVVYDNKTVNIMDAAIAQVADGVTVSCATPSGYYGFPEYSGYIVQGKGQSNFPIMKVGRTTEFTRGTTKAVNVHVRIKYPQGTAYFEDQYLTSSGFGDVGDSGALVVTAIGPKIAIGIIIGGGPDGTAVVSELPEILHRFGTSLCGQ